MKNKYFNWLLIVTIILVGCQGKKKASTDELPVIIEDTTFCFLGEAIDREENFDNCPFPVTESNIEHLYRKYNVQKIEGTDLYKINPLKLYHNSKYFTRLLKFTDG